MTKFDPHPPLFQPRVGKNFDPPTSSLDPPTYKKSRPPHLHFDNSNTGHAGRHLVWDATVVDTLGSSYVQATAAMVGAAAEISTGRKNVKHSAPLNTHVFVPL